MSDVRKVLRACTRGSASVEAVVMMPMLVLLFAGAVHVRQLGEAHHGASADARACAWAHALAGCPDAPPAACEGKAGEKRSEPGAAQEVRAGEVESYDEATGALGFLEGVLQGLWGEPLATRRAAEVPALLDGEEKAKVSTEIVLLCNPRPFAFVDFLDDIFSISGV